jgi:uncharacterized repeat protein (TIGR01451 family)
MTFVSLGQTGSPMSCVTPAVGSGGTVSCTAASYPASGTTTLTLTGHIPPGTPAGTTYDNAVTVSTTSVDPNTENDSSLTTLTVSSVNVSVAKQGPVNVNAGDIIAYALTAGNDGPDSAVNVQLLDTLPPDTTFVSLTVDAGPVATCSTPPPNENGTVSCTWAGLPSGTQSELTLRVRAGNTTAISNTATITTDSFDTNPNDNSSTSGTSVNPRADLAVTKIGPATLTAGANAAYTVTVTNNGASHASGVSMTDPVNAPLTFVSATQTSGPIFACATPAPGATGTIGCTIATLPVGATATFAIELRLAPEAPPGGAVTNTANVSTATVDPDPDNNSSSTSGTTVASADVGVAKSGPAGVVAGADATYTITVTNTGPSDAANVSLTDTLPPNTTFVSASQTTGPTFSCTTPAAGATGTITCTIATLPAGTTATFSVVLHVSADATGTIDNTATVASTTADPAADNNTATAGAPVTLPTDVGIVKTAGGGKAELLTAITYTIVVTNLGAQPASGVVVTDVLPAGTTLSSVSETQGSCSGTTTVACTIGTLPPGGTATITLVLTRPATPGPVSNTATVTSASPDTDLGNNSSTAVIDLPTAIPTLSSLAFVLLGLALAVAGWVVLRRTAIRS